jgi:glycosyltransferase involved in cell wall biosynthesis
MNDEVHADSVNPPATQGRPAAPGIRGSALRPTRVFFVNRYFFPDESATAQLLADLAFVLAARGFEIHVICSRQLYGTAGAQLAPEETPQGVFVHRVWSTRFGRQSAGRAVDYVTFYLSSFFALHRRLRAADIVVAKTDPPLISIVAAAAAKLRRATLVNWLQDIFPEVASVLGANPLPAPLNGWLRRLRDRSLRAAAVNVVLGSRMRDHLGRQGVPAEKIQIIQIWAAAEGAEPPPGHSLLRSRLGYQGKFVVGYSGNLGRAHEYHTVLGAAEALRGDDGVMFLMIGGGVNMDALRQAAIERRLSNLHFLPHQPRDSLPALEGLIVPSKFYGILAAARPVIFIGDCDGELARVIREAGCGLAVAPGQSAELSAVILNLRAHPEQCAALSAAARRLSLQAYSATRAQEIWVAMLNRLSCPPRVPQGNLRA